MAAGLDRARAREVAVIPPAHFIAIMRPSPFSFFTLVLALSCVRLGAAPASAEFRPGDRWLVVGDSITQYGSYYAWVYLYHATRFPDLDLEVVSGAISGDSAAGTVRRYDWDLRPARATVATVMLGMNDVSRELYAEGPETEETRARRAAALDGYRRSLETLVGLLRRDGVRPILVTPSPFDESPAIDFPRLPGVNRALGACAAFMRVLAEREGAAVIDLHGALTELNERRRAQDPRFTAIGRDRVHPGVPGHFAMAYFFLRGQEAPALVSRLTVDAATRRATAENATIERLAVHDGGGVEFRSLERALPYPVPDDARPALEWVPFQDELNRQVLHVAGLRPGRYALFIDDERIGDFDAGHLAAGLNLAELPTPQLRQAQEVLKLVREWQDLVANRQRAIAEVEHWKLSQLPHPISLDAARPILLAELERLKTDNRSGHAELDRSNIERYFRIKPSEVETRRQLDELSRRIRASARPRPHAYRLVPVPAPAASGQWTVRSPDGTQELTVSLDHGVLTYQVARLEQGRKTAVLAPSPLGLKTDAGDFGAALAAVAAGTSAEVNEPYEMISGKQRKLRDHHTAWSLELANREGTPFVVDFRVYNEGVAFRYRLPRLPGGTTRVVAETTGFRLPAGGRAWMQPGQAIAPWAPAYEAYYTNGAPLGADAPGKEGWMFPGLFETEGGWVMLTEAGLDGGYFGASLAPKVHDRTYTIQLPLAETARGVGAVEATVASPWRGPWRLVINGATPATIVESNLVHHVSPPPADRDWSWVKPGRATWSWWSDHASPRNFDAIKPFIDLAGDWGWEYSLIDANWNRMENGNIGQLLDYAKARGVGLLLWYNSGGGHNEITEEPRGRLNDRATRRAEFAQLQALGAKGVKVDFFQSDKQWMIAYYLEILEDAADFHLLVDFHGCTLPRGWQRTYPNLVSMEAVRGAEIYACCDDYGPAAVWQNTILPFTRNVVGSMDYTPVTFTNQKVPHRTTYAHELALSVLFESAVQHFADAVAGYRGLPDFAQAWLRAAPVAWDETRFVAGYPGELAVLARRAGAAWYVAGIEGAGVGKTLSLSLPFLPPGSYDVELIADGGDDRSFSHSRKTLSAGEPLQVPVRAAGGFVARISPR